MLLLEANQIEKSYGDRLIIKVEQLQVYEGDRIGIVGKNGEGKSTLLKMIVGELEPDQGKVQKFCSVAYIPQLEDAGFTGADKENNQWNVPLGDSLSGGEETRKKIAAALSSDANVIVADEPTSHLDVKGVEKFEQEMQSFRGAFVIISHDRQLLNQVCTSIWEVEGGEVTTYEGNYSDYLDQKGHAKKREWFEYEQYQKEKERLVQAKLEKSKHSKSLKKAPKRMGNSEARLHKRSVGLKKAKLDKSGKSIQSRIDQLEKKERPKTEDELIFDMSHFKPIHSRAVVSFDRVSARVGARTLFTDLQGFIKPGEKVAITGDNGTGKSTLLKMLVRGYDGISVAQPAVIGYFHQQLENLEENKSILENVKETSQYSEQFIRTVLSRLLFKREEVQKQVHMLSGGERVKTALAKVFLGDYNVLLLDEPTNFLDLHTKEALQTVLKSYPGTILFVTHDRYFVKELAKRVIVIENEKAVLKEIDNLNQIDKSVGKQNDESNALAIEMELTETISKLSMSVGDKEKEELEEKYQELLKMRKRLNK
ncbi:ribosomal protection-like ABC-F family protein [Alteribacter populi]|uniref:ribosomal protection-like ABC-F family protein n=1 Tax=Alteribacter populi TaxID=2011011 RepID=UPI000BBA80A4|nr:ABC-F type ribosomal protection protein [Alteribacter populi]